MSLKPVIKNRRRRTENCSSCWFNNINNTLTCLWDKPLVTVCYSPTPEETQNVESDQGPIVYRNKDDVSDASHVVMLEEEDSYLFHLSDDSDTTIEDVEYLEYSSDEMEEIVAAGTSMPVNEQNGDTQSEVSEMEVKYTAPIRRRSARLSARIIINVDSDEEDKIADRPPARIGGRKKQNRRTVVKNDNHVANKAQPPPVRKSKKKINRAQKVDKSDRVTRSMVAQKNNEIQNIQPTVHLKNVIDASAKNVDNSGTVNKESLKKTKGKKPKNTEVRRSRRISLRANSEANDKEQSRPQLLQPAVEEEMNEVSDQVDKHPSPPGQKPARCKSRASSTKSMSVPDNVIEPCQRVTRSMTRRLAGDTARPKHRAGYPKRRCYLCDT